MKEAGKEIPSVDWLVSVFLEDKNVDYKYKTNLKKWDNNMSIFAGLL